MTGTAILSARPVGSEGPYTPTRAMVYVSGKKTLEQLERQFTEYGGEGGLEVKRVTNIQVWDWLDCKEVPVPIEKEK